MNNISKGDSTMNQLADNKKLMDFLLYSYFGFSSGDLDQTKKVKCSYRAYLDLARTVKYTYSSTELEKATVGTDAYAFISVQKDRIKFICSKLIESIEGYPNHSGGFNTWHESKCAQIIDRMNGDIAQTVRRVPAEEKAAVAAGDRSKKGGDRHQSAADSPASPVTTPAPRPAVV